MPVEVFVADEQSAEPVDVERWGGLAKRVLTDRGLTDPAELNVLFVDTATIASLNERFLGHAGPTDVLSFPIEDDVPTAGRKHTRPDAAPFLLGDVVICPEVARRNAPGHAGSYEDELALLLVHGILHLLGMDHADDDEAAEMEALESSLLARHHSAAVAGGS